MSVQDKAIQKYVAILNALGADYTIRFGGRTYSNNIAAAAEAVSAVVVAKAKRGRVTRSFKETGYGEAIRAMQPGSIVEFKRGQFPSIESKAAFASFASCVCNYARRHFDGKVVNEYKSREGTVVTMRVE